VDPRQRSSDRRFFKAIVIWILAGAGLIGLGSVFALAGVDIWASGYRAAPLVLLFPMGAVVVGTGCWALVRRAVRGPDQPGKRARC
jgi:hypothetical protein